MPAINVIQELVLVAQDHMTIITRAVTLLLCTLTMVTNTLKPWDTFSFSRIALKFYL